MKNTLITLSLMLVSSVLYAQKLKFGGGLNFSDISSSEDVINGKGGLQFGVGFEFGEGKMYVEPGLFYTVKKFDFVENSTSFQRVEFPEVEGIRVPINLGMYLVGNSESLIAWRAFGGPSAFILTDRGDFEENIKSTNWGVFAGTGLNLSVIFIDLAYEWSVHDISTQFTTIDFGRTNGFFVQAGLRFKL